MSALLTIIFGLLGLGIIVFVHELGHFVAAKAMGIHVEVFSLGWGSRLVGFQRGDTYYQISWFPLGGYCKMKGEMPRVGMTDEEITAMREERGAFLAAAPWRRILVALGGPLANFVFAVLVLTLIWWIGYNVHSAESRIILASHYDEKSYPADAAGLQTGDRIISIGEDPTASFWHVSEIVRRSPGKALELVVQRGGRNVGLTIVPEPDQESGMGRVGIYAWFDPVVGQVLAGTPADIAGLQPGDNITSVDGKPVANSLGFFTSLDGVLEGAGEKRVEVEYTRARTSRRTTLFLVPSAEGGLDPGLRFQDKVFRSPRMGLGQSLVTGANRSLEVFALSVQGIRQLASARDRKLNDVVAGPIRITRMVGEAARSGLRLGIGEGLVSFFQFVSLLSIAIAMMNLLPLPALDGGLIILSAAEGVVRKPLAPKILWRFQIAGVIVIVGILFLAITSDILSFMG